MREFFSRSLLLVAAKLAENKALQSLQAIGVHATQEYFLSNIARSFVIASILLCQIDIKNR